MLYRCQAPTRMAHNHRCLFIVFNIIFLCLNIYMFQYGYDSDGREVRESNNAVDDPQYVDQINPDDDSDLIEEDRSSNKKQHTAVRCIMPGPGEMDKLNNSSNFVVVKVGKQHAAQAAEKSNIERKTPQKTSEEYAQLRKTYQIPKIATTHLVNCVAILQNDSREISRAKQVMKDKTKIPIYEETYQEWFKDCDQFKTHRGYIEIPLTKEEEDFPLAFSIAMFKDVEQVERLLRAIYQPQNLYCIHIDTKSSLLIHKTMQEMVKCFDNVWIATHLDKIKWGDVSVLLPDINCMRDLIKYHRGKFKYYINLTGQEFPLRTNYELVRIANIFGGSNDIAGSVKSMEMDRVNFVWTHRWSKRYQQTIFYKTRLPKTPWSTNITFYKGELHALFSHNMVQYIVEDERAKNYLVWCWDSGHPSEHYWNTLNYNQKLQAPGGYQGPSELAEKYQPHPIVRAKHWVDINHKGRKCLGQIVRGICIYGIGDIPWLAQRRELFANKFHLNYHYLGYDCLEERHRNRTMLKDKIHIDEHFYRNIPTAKYGRKDGV